MRTIKAEIADRKSTAPATQKMKYEMRFKKRSDRWHVQGDVLRNPPVKK